MSTRTNLSGFIWKLRNHFTSALDGHPDAQKFELAFERAINKATHEQDAPAPALAKSAAKSSQIKPGSKAAKDRAAKAQQTRLANKAAKANSGVTATVPADTSVEAGGAA